MLTLSKTRALEIQAEQIEYYAVMYGDAVRVLVAAATRAHMLPDDGEQDIVLVNRHIPRGGKIEYIIRVNELEFTPEARARQERIAAEWDAIRAQGAV